MPFHSSSLSHWSTISVWFSFWLGRCVILLLFIYSIYFFFCFFLLSLTACICLVCLIHKFTNSLYLSFDGSCLCAFSLLLLMVFFFFCVLLFIPVVRPENDHEFRIFTTKSAKKPQCQSFECFVCVELDWQACVPDVVLKILLFNILLRLSTTSGASSSSPLNGLKMDFV